MARGYGIVLVFEGHILDHLPGSAAGLVDKAIYSFHMPFFFLISGFLAHRKAANLKVRFLTRFLPFLFFDLLSVVILLVVQAVTGAWNLYYDACGVLAVCRGFPAFNFTLWFLICLLVIELLDVATHHYLKSAARVTLATGGLFGLGLLVVWKERFFVEATGLAPDYWYIKQALLACPFYQAGNLIRSAGWLKATDRRRDLAVLVVAGGLWLAGWNLNISVDIAHARVGNPALYLANGLTGTAFLIALARLTNPLAPLLFLGRKTLILLGLNGIWAYYINLELAHRLAASAPGANGMLLLLGTLACALSLLISVPAILVLDRYLPQLVGNPRARGPLLPALLSDRPPADRVASVLTPAAAPVQEASAG